ncbi:hypothetical protein [Gordonia oryzae]|uniref:hypothetical protein n=1 Tax=Gordonia oryzae TaxID=2487349 RepID=UPI001FE57349|nr:hypothetical protein [Gordonia oryzae]
MASAAILAIGAPALTDTPAVPPTSSIQGDLHLTPTIRVLRIDAQGSRTAGATTGTYTATLLGAVNPTPIQVRCPVTRINVDGNAPSLIYPISDIRPFRLPARRSTLLHMREETMTTARQPRRIARQHQILRPPSFNAVILIELPDRGIDRLDRAR